jgi:hypothetical protein
MTGRESNYDKMITYAPVITKGKQIKPLVNRIKLFQWTYLGLLLEVEPLFFGVASVFFGFGFDWDVNVEEGFVCYIMD